MKMTKTLLMLLGCLTLGAAGLSQVAQVRAADMAPTTQPVDPTPVNKTCPVSGDAVDPKVTTTYDGKTYAFCCSDCVKTFKKDPQKYAAKAK